MSTPLLTLANQLTIVRMAMAPFLVVFVVDREFRWALVVFVVAGVTDLLDGFVARVGRQQTTLGAMLDPMADKVLLASCFVALTWGSGLYLSIPVWLTVVTLSRDTIILVSVAIINLTLGRRVFYPSLLGKLSTLSQLVTAGMVLLVNARQDALPGMRTLFRITLLLTVASAACARRVS